MNKDKWVGGSEETEKWFIENYYKEDCDCVACGHYRYLVKVRISGESADKVEKE